MKNIRMTTDEWLNQAIEITLKSEDSFLVVKETLTRIGISSTKKGVKKLFQTCHIFQKRGKYYIVHFKELLLLDGKEVNFSEEDAARRNTIANLLEEWDLVEIIGDIVIDENKNPSIKIVPFKEKSEWELIPKYTIGRK